MEPIMMENEEGANVGMRPTPSIKKGHEKSLSVSRGEVHLMTFHVSAKNYTFLP